MKGKDNRGGFRLGAGRPKAENPPRKLRGLKFSEQEWETIKANAARANKSAREYLSWLVAQDDSRINGENEP